MLQLFGTFTSISAHDILNMNTSATYNRANMQKSIFWWANMKVLRSLLPLNMKFSGTRYQIQYNEKKGEYALFLRIDFQQKCEYGTFAFL